MGCTSFLRLHHSISLLPHPFSLLPSSQAQLSVALDGLRRVGDKLAELDTRDGELASKLAAIGQTMPIITSVCMGAHGYMEPWE